ncbi:MAG TPA: YegS/Rv2252/BmrU family lipid kinase [Gemmatimonadaceae bacterium]
MSAKVSIVVNPTAGRGQGAKKLESVVAAFGGISNVDLLATRDRAEEHALTRAAIARGATVIVALGGDGTCANIAQAILHARSNCALAVVAAGTGNDFAKTLGVIGYKPAHIAALVKRESPRRIDVGIADGHFFLNSCGFGFDPSVLEASNRVRFLKGDAVYIYSALRQLFSYPGVDVSTNGVARVKRGRMLMITVSNGRFLGGAFRIAPHASVLDGRLDACFFSDANLVERVRLFAGAMRGTHLGMPSVSSASVRELALTFTDEPKMEMDGELRTARSRTVELKCVPRALSVVAAPGALV